MPYDLKMEDLLRLYDSVKSVVYVHPEDLGRPLVNDLRANGYQIETRDAMLKGKAFMQNICNVALIDFEKGAYVAKNALAELATRQASAPKADL